MDWTARVLVTTIAITCPNTAPPDTCRAYSLIEGRSVVPSCNERTQQLWHSSSQPHTWVVPVAAAAAAVVMLMLMYNADRLFGVLLYSA
jgi:anti-sigma-K factor RskA